MSITELVVVALAARAALNLWLSEDSFLLEYRAVTQEWRWQFGRSLLNCRFCLSYWVAAAVLGGFYLPLLILSESWHELARTPVYILAVSGLVQIIDNALNKYGSAATEEFHESGSHHSDT